MQTKREPQHHHELEKRSIIRKLTKEDLLISEAKAVASQEISKETFKCHEKGKKEKNYFFSFGEETERAREII